MAIRFFQSGDYSNTILRKLLGNSGEFSEARAVFADSTTPSTPVRDYELGDDDNTILRKLLENEAASLV